MFSFRMAMPAAPSRQPVDVGREIRKSGRNKGVTRSTQWLEGDSSDDLIVLESIKLLCR